MEHTFVIHGRVGSDGRLLIIGTLEFGDDRSYAPKLVSLSTLFTTCLSQCPNRLTSNIQTRDMFRVRQVELEDLGIVVVVDDLGELQINEALVAAGESLRHGGSSLCISGRLSGCSGSSLAASEE